MGFETKKRNWKFPLTSLLIIIIFLGIGCLVVNKSDNASTEIDRDAILLEAKRSGLIMGDTEYVAMTDRSVLEEDGGEMNVTAEQILAEGTSFIYSAALADVTGGESYGIARSVFSKGVYTLAVELGNLPETGEDFFYEGWLVRRGEDLSVMSTGPVEVVDGKFVNVYRSNSDLTDHNFYVLTLELNDGDPAPAEHILEGTFRK